MKYIFILLLSALSLQPAVAKKKSIYHKGWIDFNKNGTKDIFEDPGQTVEKRVADLLSQMTMEEKTCQLVTLYGFGRVLKDSLPTERWKNELWKDGLANIDEQLNGVGSGYRRAKHLIYPYSGHIKAKNIIQKWFIENTRLGIPVEFSNEGIHGLNHTKATPLPAPIGVASTWNTALVRKAGEIIGREARLLGYHSVYAPILDVARDPRWGRCVETFGEDPFLVAEMGIALSGGIQAQKVASLLKHFAAYSVPKGGRDGACRTDPHISPRELHEIHLYPFKRVIQEVKPLGVMSSYNDWNGEPVTASYYFLTELLREIYGFDGIVVSDSDAVEFVHGKHKVAETYDEAVRQVLTAGLNVRTNFSHPAEFVLAARRLIKEEKIPMAVIDKRVSEVLRVKFRLGLFDHPLIEDETQADKVVGVECQQEFVDEMQAQSLVLLKNEQELLPLDKSRIKSICISGPLADEDNFMISRYGPNKLETTTVLKGIKEFLGGQVEINYAKGCEIIDKNWPDSEIVPTPLDDEEKRMMEEAVAAARKSDVVIAVLGEDEYRVGESRSRTSLNLPGRQQQLLEALHRTGKPVVLVLINGQPLTVNWADRYVPSILEALFPSCRGGKVIAETLFGERTPGGKLPVTFPKSTGQIELNFPFKKGSHGQQYSQGPNGAGKTRVINALYPFGHGLSYTKFKYDNIEIDDSRYATDKEIDIRCKVTNIGQRYGEEVAQLYIADKYSSVTTYESVLRGFERIKLRAGESKEVSFVVNEKGLEILDKEMKWTAEPGEFEVRIGSSSNDIRLKSSFHLR